MEANPTKTTGLIVSYSRELQRLIENFQAKALTVVPRAVKAYEQRSHEGPRMLVENSLVAEIDDIIASLERSEIQQHLKAIVKRYTYQSYRKGAEKGVSRLQKARYNVSFAWTQTDIKAVTAMVDHNLIEIRGMEDYLKKEVMRVLATGMMEGRGIEPIAKALVERCDVTRNRARMIARTETIRNYNQAGVERYRQAGLEKWMWVAASDERECEECASRDGHVFDMGDPQPPEPHPNCLLPGTRFETPGRIIAGLRAWYDGEAVELVFSKGRRLAVTSNHMFLTPWGWITVNLLRKGDDVFNCTGFNRIIDTDPNYYHGPPLVEDKFESFRIASGMSPRIVPSASEYLHGDGRFVNGDVEVVSTDCFLWSANESLFFQKTTEQDFRAAYSKAAQLPGLSPLTKVFFSAAHAADSIMGGRRQTSAFFKRRLTHPEEHGLASVPLGNSSLVKSSDYAVPVDIENLRECFDRVPSIVQLDKILEVNILPYHGWVYDFQTLTSLSICNSILTSNCRCSVAPYVDEELTPSKGGMRA